MKIIKYVRDGLVANTKQEIIYTRVQMHGPVKLLLQGKQGGKEDGQASLRLLYNVQKQGMWNWRTGMDGRTFTVRILTYVDLMFKKECPLYLDEWKLEATICSDKECGSKWNYIRTYKPRKRRSIKEH